MDILNGRIISIIGFVTSMICSLAIALAQPYISYNIIIILNWINCFAILFATIGFGLKWLKGHENLDLITAIAVGIVALRPIMQLFWYTPFINALLQILSCVHFFVFALRALRFNRGNLNKLVAFICVCAGIYTLVGSALLQLLFFHTGISLFRENYEFTRIIHLWLSLFASAICWVIRIIECVQETD